MACGASAGTSASEWLRRGESLLAKRPEQARACFSDSALADPLSYRPLEQLGLAQLDQQANVPLSTAAATLRRAAHLALRQGNRSAAAAVHRAVGEAHARRQDWAPASTAFGKAFKLAPTDCVLSAHLAQARAAQGQHKRAVAALRAALAEDHACLTAHQWLARVLPSTGDLRGALQHARAALELNPYEPESNELLAALLARPGAAAAEQPSGWQSSAPAAAEVESCSGSWSPPRPPVELALPAGCPEPGSGRAPAELLLVNPFEEGCFHEDLKAGVRHDYHSCGQALTMAILTVAILSTALLTMATLTMAILTMAILTMVAPRLPVQQRARLAAARARPLAAALPHAATAWLLRALRRTPHTRLQLRGALAAHL